MLLFVGSLANRVARAPDPPSNLQGVLRCVLIVPQLACTCCHLSEMSRKPASYDRAAGIMGECANLANYVARICYAAAVHSEDPGSKEIACELMAAAKGVVAVLELGEACIPVK